MKEVLSEGLPALGLDASKTAPLLERFAEKLIERNSVMNLTAITEPKDIAALHLLDSLALIPAAGLTNGKIIDVGTGAGFPGLPLAIALPELEVTLLDSQRKRIEFLREVCGELSIKNAKCVHARAEEYASERRETYDYAVSRAVAALPVLTELCLPFVSAGGRFLAMKSSHSDEETEQSKRAIRLLGGRIAWIKDYQIPATEVTHRIICIEKISLTPEKYPRRYAQIRKSPL